MAGKALPNFYLTWNQAEHYWICITPPESEISYLESLLDGLGLTVEKSGGSLVVKAPQLWGDVWRSIISSADKTNIWRNMRFSIIAEGDIPTPQLIELNERSFDDIEKLVSSLWLGRALLEDRVVCYLQPVMDRRGKVFGYESFARIVEEDGTVVAGGKIFDASADLQIEYALDRYLQVQSIRSFVETDLDGVLFINFVPGFIHRPEKYLEGFSDTVQALGVSAKHIVLDITKADLSFESVHLRGIFEYCKSRGYAVALDDMDCVSTARRLLNIGRPDYMKLDIKLVQNVEQLQTRQVVEQLVDLARNTGCAVIAEGVEDESMFSTLKHVGVDLFQGYYFSPPVAAEKVARREVS